ncbi:MAG: zf-HC2 domain-containing protein [Planctomycetota bacterium]|jgi:tetratricopeptide (TPR) repeat protein
MDCTEVRETLVSRALGVLDADDAAEFDAHAASCAGCGALAGAGEEALGILRDWRAATDAPLDEAETEAFVSGLAAIESARAERATARRSAREAAAPPKRGGTVFLIVGALVLLGGAAAAYVFLIDVPPPARPDPLGEIAPLITNGERARDAACVMDAVLLDEMKYATPSNRRIASVTWARAMARREGFAARTGFVRAALGADAGPVAENAPPAPLPLRLAGDLELAGLHAAAEAECERVIAAARTGDLRRRAKLHLAAALLGQGRLGPAMKTLDEIAPPPPAPAEGGTQPAAAAPRDFIARLAEVLRARAIEAAKARESLAGYTRQNTEYADDRGGKMAIDALELDRAAELLAGKDPSNMGPLVRGWMQLLRGEVEAAEADLVPVSSKGQRYYRGLSSLALAECAFRQGRFRTARYYLKRACNESVEDYDQRFFFAVQLRRVTHAAVDFGRPAFITSDLELVPAEGGLRALVDSVIVTRVDPLAKARDAITKDWITQRSPFDAALGPPKSGEVIAREAVPKIDFDSERAELEPAAGGTEVDGADGLEGRGARVSSAGSSAAARLVFEEPVPEVETWVAFAVKLESPGMFAVWAKEAAGSGALFRWRTASLPAGKWCRIAVPLGAFEPEKPTGGDQSLLMKRLYSIGFSLAAGAGKRAGFILDDILVHHGLVPAKTDDPPESAKE